MFRRIWSFFNRWEGLILLLLLTVILRVPSLFEPHHYGDEEIYFVLGRAWRAGWELYRDVFDHKPPLIYIFAGLFPTVLGFRFILLVWTLIHTVLYWLLARILTGTKRTFLPFLATLTFVILNSLPLLEGNIANGELFMMMPVTAGALLLWLNKRQNPWHYFLAGVLVGVGFLFKVPVLFDFLAFLVFFWFFQAVRVGDIFRAFLSKGLWLTTLGFLAPLAVSLAYYASRGILSEYVQTALLFNFGYVSSWSTHSQTFNPFQSGLFVRGLVLAIYSLILFAFRSRLQKPFVFTALWVGFSLFGALLSGRPYPHYLLQPVVPATLLTPFIFLTETVWGWTVVSLIIGLAMLTQRTIKFWGYPTASYYQNFFQYATNKISYEEYEMRFDGVRRNYAVAKYLRTHMLPNETLYVWGTDPSLYNLTDRLPTGGKYIVSFHVDDLGAYGEVMRHISANKPSFVVILPDSSSFPDLIAYLTREYELVRTIEGASLYKRH